MAFRFTVPTVPFRVGESTWISPEGIPIFLGSRVAHRSRTVWATASSDCRRMKKKSEFTVFSSGICPWFTRWAFMTIRLCWACRKTEVSRTALKQPERSISPKGKPGPTGGS